MWILYTVIGFIVYIIVGIVLWRSFNFFKMNLWRHASMTGFQYFCEKFSFAWILPLVVAFFIRAFYADATNKNSSNASNSSSVSSGSSRSSYASPVATQPANTGSQESSKPSAQYDGDDPIVRARLGLPPKD